MEYTYLVLILLAGILSSMQTGINSQLRTHVGTPLLSCTVSFVAGLSALIVVTMVACGHLFPSAEVLSTIPWWAWGGGLLGVVGVTGNILLFPRLGRVLTVLIPMTGQIITSMLIDSFGWFATDRIPMSNGRIAGLVLVLAGLYLYMRSKKAAASSVESSPKMFLWVMLALLVGFSFAAQPVLNGYLARAFSSSIQSAFISFGTATAILAALLIFFPYERRNLTSIRFRGSRWWFWTGGFLGAYYVTVFALVTPLIGIGITSLVGILGMILCSTIIDSRGLFGTVPQTIRPLQYAALALLFLGVVCIKLW